MQSNDSVEAGHEPIQNDAYAMNDNKSDAMINNKFDVQNDKANVMTHDKGHTMTDNQVDNIIDNEIDATNDELKASEQSASPAAAMKPRIVGNPPRLDYGDEMNAKFKQLKDEFRLDNSAEEWLDFCEDFYAGAYQMKRDPSIYFSDKDEEWVKFMGNLNVAAYKVKRSFPEEVMASIGLPGQGKIEGDEHPAQLPEYFTNLSYDDRREIFESIMAIPRRHWKKALGLEGDEQESEQ